MDLRLPSHRLLDTLTVEPSLPAHAPGSRCYIIASTNRTGSYLLCEGLKMTGLAGFPAESLHPEYRDALCRRFYGEELDLSDSIRALVHHESTPNGFFGAKLHWDQMERIAYESGYNGPPYMFLLKDFPLAQYIHISRRDTLSQAISLSIAQQTGVWRLLAGEIPTCPKAGPPLFNSSEILRLEQDLIRQRDAWEAFFNENGIAPLRMEYEALAGDYRGQVGRALAFLGLDAAAACSLPEPETQKQGDELNELWLSWMKPRVVA